MIKPGLHQLWRGTSTLQLGLGPRAVTVRGFDSRSRERLRSLDGSRTRDQLAHGPAGQVLEVLGRLGALDDGPDTAVPPHLLPDRSSLSLLHPEPGAADRLIAARAATRVEVVGGGRVAQALASLLAASGLHEAELRERPQPAAPAHAVVLAPERGLPAAALTADLVRRGIPHLQVQVLELTATVGPLVLPGATACLGCVHLHRCDRDPGWSVVAPQIERATAGTPACDTALAAWAAATAALQLLGWLDSTTVGGPGAAVLGGALELALPDWRTRRRSWAPHPACTCPAATAWRA